MQLDPQKEAVYKGLPSSWYRNMAALDQGNENTYTKVTTSKGKGLFAKRKLMQGDPIVVEKPLICCQFPWNSFYKYVACDHCLKSMETAEEMARRLSSNSEIILPKRECCEIERCKNLFTTKCPSCDVLYCCDECRIEANEKYHKILCLGLEKGNADHPLNRIDEAWRNFHYPPETASIGLICRIIAMVLQTEDKEAMMNVFSSFCNSPHNFQDKMVHKLLGKNFIDHLELLRTMLLNSFEDKSIEQWLTPDGFRSLLAMIGMNGQGIGTSSLSQYVHNVDALTLDEEERKCIDAQIDKIYDEIDKESGQFLNCEGSGLYITQSCCNHSCDPNAEVTFPYNNSTLVLVALNDIEENEEICICYLDECQRERSRHSRQKILRGNYLFNCTCSRCQSQCDMADETSSSEDESCCSSMEEN